MTITGENRRRYAEQVERGPSRFANQGADYRAWAARGDAWARGAHEGDL